MSDAQPIGSVRRVAFVPAHQRDLPARIAAHTEAASGHRDFAKTGVRG